MHSARCTSELPDGRQAVGSTQRTRRPMRGGEFVIGNEWRRDRSHAGRVAIASVTPGSVHDNPGVRRGCPRKVARAVCIVNTGALSAWRRGRGVAVWVGIALTYAAVVAVAPAKNAQANPKWSDDSLSSAAACCRAQCSAQGEHGRWRDAGSIGAMGKARGCTGECRAGLAGAGQQAALAHWTASVGVASSVAEADGLGVLQKSHPNRGDGFF